MYKENNWLCQWIEKVYGGEQKTVKIIERSANCTNKNNREIFIMGMNDMNNLSHTKWNCKYYIVFTPKRRRKVFYKDALVNKNWTLNFLLE